MRIERSGRLGRGKVRRTGSASAADESTGTEIAWAVSGVAWSELCVKRQTPDEVEVWSRR